MIFTLTREVHQCYFLNILTLGVGQGSDDLNSTIGAKPLWPDQAQDRDTPQLLSRADMWKEFCPILPFEGGSERGAACNQVDFVSFKHSCLNIQETEKKLNQILLEPIYSLFLYYYIKGPSVCMMLCREHNIGQVPVPKSLPSHL